MAQGYERHIRDVLTVDQDAALVEAAQTLQQSERGGLARARRPDEGDRLPGRSVDIDVEYALVAVPEAEGDVLVAHVPGHVGKR